MKRTPCALVEQSFGVGIPVAEDSNAACFDDPDSFFRRIDFATPDHAKLEKDMLGHRRMPAEIARAGVERNDCGRIA